MPPLAAQPRHYGIALSFVLAVVVPTVAAVFYLFAIAEDQYTSTTGFAVRSEDITSALGLLGGISSLSGQSSSDTDVLYQFIQSQELVQRVDARVDLRAIYTRPAFDPVFAFREGGVIEDLVPYWRRMVRIFYDRGTGLIELRVHAFDPRDAQRIAEAIFDESSIMINDLSAIARADATRYAREELERATEQLREARIALTAFRSQNQLVDPAADIQGQMGLLNPLQQQLASAYIEANLLRQTARPGDPRIDQGERRIAVIEELIAAERAKFGMGGAMPAAGGRDFAALMGEFERLSVDREFAEKSYLAARTAYDNALTEAQRQSRYLAAYIRPTLAEESRHPRHFELSALVAGFGVLLWSIGLLVYYRVRDRR